MNATQSPETETRGSHSSPPHGSVEHRALLWDAINQYAESCGGKPHERVYGNTRRQRCVAQIEALIFSPNDQVDLPDPDQNS